MRILLAVSLLVAGALGSGYSPPHSGSYPAPHAGGYPAPHSGGYPAPHSGSYGPLFSEHELAKAGEYLHRKYCITRAHHFH